MQLIEYELKKFLQRLDAFEHWGELTGNLPKLDRKGPWVAGGVLRRLISGEKDIDSDIDVFFANFQQLEAFKDGLRKADCELKRENEYNSTWLMGELEVQLIHIKFYKSPAELLDSFDFTLCQLATDGKTLWCAPYALWDIGRKRLVLHRLTYAVASVRRLLKYGAQGFTVCSGAIAQILHEAQKNPETVETEVRYVD